MIDTAIEAAPLGLVLVPCPLCSADDAEPVAVGRDFDLDTSPDSFLAVCCRGCGLVYLNPTPTSAARSRLYPTRYFSAPSLIRDRGDARRAAARLAVDRCRGLPSGAQVLELGYGDSLHLEDIRREAPPSWTLEAVTPHAALAEVAKKAGFGVHPGTAAELGGHAAKYDAVLLLHALEHSASPLHELRSLRPLLRRGGQVVIVAQNADSAVSRRFRGRHWAGYDFPRHRALFSPRSLRQLAEKAGFVVEGLRTVGYAPMWSRSAANFLDDWSAPTWLRRQARSAGFVAAGLAAVAEAAAGRRERAGWLEAVLGCPVVASE